MPSKAFRVAPIHIRAVQAYIQPRNRRDHAMTAGRPLLICADDEKSRLVAAMIAKGASNQAGRPSAGRRELLGVP